MLESWREIDIFVFYSYIEEQVAWSPGFLEALSSASQDVESQELIDQMNQAIAATRTRKTAPRL